MSEPQFEAYMLGQALVYLTLALIVLLWVEYKVARKLLEELRRLFREAHE